MLHKDREWLYEQRFRQYREIKDIAKECNVDEKTIRNYIKKFSIPKLILYRDLNIPLLCHNCKNAFSKDLEYLLSNVRRGTTRFHCSRKCADITNSKLFSGDNSSFKKMSHEQRLDIVERATKTKIERGSLIGAKNGMWRGGKRDVSCIICCKNHAVELYRYIKIKQGLRESCCSVICSTIHANRSVRKKGTSIEIKMADELTRRAIVYEDQYNLGNKFALDFFLPEYGIVIECDGDYWHRLPDAIIRDKRKNAYVKACGHTILRFWESEINESVEACVDIVMAEINAMEAV